ncbi:MAG: PKD domain-containing protein [Flavobacteriales bacterium]|nr:PKD domain-containing protein [Flavobacteriales bacterium]
MSKYQTLQLDELSYEYELFRENQLLTHNQLNKFIRYFEDQDRITRTYLIGVGLVCGLSVKSNSNSIWVNKGCGVTTDGDLLVMEGDTQYRYFKKYENKTKKGDPIYDPFYSAADKKEVDLWELRKENKDENDVPTNLLSTFKTVTTNELTDMVALLYMENFLADPDDCTSIDCNHLGQMQNNKIRVLLINQTDVEKLINREPGELMADDIYKNFFDAYDQYFTLPELKAKRVHFTAANSSDLATLQGDYRNAVTSGVSALADAIEKLYNTFKFLIDKTSYFNINSIKNKINTKLSSASTNQQYTYDFYKDLVDCYNEMKDTIYNAVYICCPDKYAFPKHIMLGIVNAPLGPKPPRFRHYFYPSPVVSKGKSYVSVTISMFNRFTAMLDGFSVPGTSAAIQITPSVSRDRTIEWRSIPFYYNNADSLKNNWSYYRTTRGSEKNILSYHAGGYNSNPLINTPLDYDIDKFNFFRIEGHQGKKLGTALDSILSIKNNKNLPFDVVAVKLKSDQDGDLDLEEYAFYFEDLNTILNAWIVEQNCLYAKAVKFFSAFNSKGKHASQKGLDMNVATDEKTGIKIAEEKVGAKEIKEAESKIIAKVSQAKAKTESSFTIGNIGDSMEFEYLKYQNNDFIGGYLYTEDEQSIGALIGEMGFINNSWMADTLILNFDLYIKSNEFFIQLNEEEKRISVKIPVAIIAKLNDLINFSPFEISDLRGNELDEYKQKLEALCTTVDESYAFAVKYFRKVDNSTENEYLSTLQALKDNCCAAEKLEILFNEIEKRKKTIADSLVLSKYAAKHKGLEHKAGVERGGTFVMLYASVEDEDVNEKDKLMIMLKRYKRESKLSKGKLPDMEDYYDEDVDYFLVVLAYNSRKFDVQKEVIDYVKYKNKIAKKNPVTLNTLARRLTERYNFIRAKIISTPQNTTNENVVVADFSIPYICCSDMPPMVFVLPEKKATLLLPVNEICNDGDKILFTKIPNEGTIKSLTKEAETAIVSEENETYFYPGKLPESQYGKKIIFTLDDTETGCFIVVHKKPVAKFSSELVKESSLSVRMKFLNNSDDETGEVYTYEWDFGDGKGTRTTKSKEDINVIYLREELNGQTKVKVKLTALNGTCKSLFEEEIILKEVQPEPEPEPPVVESVSLSKTVVCINEKQVSITDIVPPNAELTCVEVPEIITSSNKLDLFKIPNSKLGAAIHFKVNGKNVSTTLTVFAEPNNSFSIISPIQRNGNNITFDIKMDNPQGFKYSISEDGTGLGIFTPNSNNLIRISNLNITNKKQVSIKIIADVDSNSPCDNIAIEQVVTVPDIITQPPIEEPAENECGKLVKANLNEKMTELKEGLKTVKDQNLVALGKLIVKDYEKVITVADNLKDGEGIRNTVLERLLASINKVAKVSPKTLAEAKILGLYSYYIFALMLDVIMCSQELKKSVNASISIFEIYFKQLPVIMKSEFKTAVPTKKYNESFETFPKTFVSQDQNINKAMAKLKNIIND